MRTAVSRAKFPLSLMAGMAIGIGGAAAAGPMPDTENGRYTLSPVTDGIIRLDTRTGEVSTCSNNGNGWACYAVPDERAALDAEIGRLQADNEKLRTQLVERDATATGKIDEPLPKSDPLNKPEPKRLLRTEATPRHGEQLGDTCPAFRSDP